MILRIYWELLPTYKTRIRSQSNNGYSSQATLESPVRQTKQITTTTVHILFDSIRCGLQIAHKIGEALADSNASQLIPSWQLQDG